MKILVTGSNGLVGSTIVRVGHEDPNLTFIACSKSENKLPNFGNYEFEQCDISNQSALNSLFVNYTIDAVINTAAISKPDFCEVNKELCWKVNVEAVQLLAEKCHSLQIPLVHLSSDFIFDGFMGNYSEDSQPNPLSFYGKSKEESERIVLQFPLNSAVRTSLVYGLPADYSKGNILTWVVNSLRSSKKIRVVNDQYRTPTYANDLALGCLEILKRRKSGIYNLSGNVEMSVFNFALSIAECFDLDTSLISSTDTLSLNEPAKRPMKTGLQISRAMIDLNYLPTNPAEGLRHLLNKML